MSSMFDTFDYQKPWDFPDNMHKYKEYPKQISVTKSNLDIMLNPDNSTKGYSWNYSETCQIPISVNKTINVYSTDYVTDIIGDHPKECTRGDINQKFYNTVEVRSWTCLSYDLYHQCYYWKEDDLVTFPEDGDRLITLKPIMLGKTIIAKIINFRKEEMFTFYYKDVNCACIDITKSISDKLLRGVYTLEIFTDNDMEHTLVGRYEIVVR